MPRSRLALAACVAIIPSTAAAQEQPEGFNQLLARGTIASVDAPTYVAAADAELPDDAWVLGAVIEGQALAYSVNLLNAHEVVNDKIGDTAFAAVW
ncbi:MAG: DUF3179 domain-containing protein [Acidobacteria bacterium]|nr:DUF3179 domain-containing protein [Acidobacteriota bacterium]